MNLFELLLNEHLDRVRSINRSEQSGSPLSWCDEWSEYIPNMLQGWTSGLMLISGQSNHGKSSVAISLALNFLRANPHLWLVDFSMDDDVRDRLSKYVALLSGLPPEAVKMEYDTNQKLQDNPRVLELYQRRLQQGYDELRAFGRLMVLDSQTMYELLHAGEQVSGIVTPTIENIRAAIMKLYGQIRNTDAQLLVLIDALNDVLAASDGRYSSDNERLSRIATELMTISQAVGVRIIATTHARKLTNWRKPTMDDVYGASVLKYAAKVITFVYNDYKARRNESSLSIDVTPTDDELIDFYRAYYGIRVGAVQRTAPILIWNFLKNKTSGADGETFLTLNPFTTEVRPVSYADWDYYRSLLYQ